MTPRPFLVWCSTKHGESKAELFGENRMFDVALHDYAPWTTIQRTAEAEYYLPSEGTEKFETAAANPLLLMQYDAVAFLDDDLEISTTMLNRLFLIGITYGLQIYQPALSRDSFYSHEHLRQDDRLFSPPIRCVPFVEVMCPFFSADALKKCLWSFDLNQSGWGLDCFIWNKLCKTHVLDIITVGHHRPPARRLRTMRNGLTPFQELDIVKKIQYDGSLPW
jgi:hypothetical protein